MKRSKIISTAAVLILAAVLPAYGQKDQKDNSKDQPQHAPQAKQQEPSQQQRPAQQPQQAKPVQSARQPRQQAPQQSRQQPARQSPQQSPQQNQGHPQQAAAPAQQQTKPSPVRGSEQRSQPAAQQSARTPQAQPHHAPAVAARVQAPQAQRSAAQAQSWQQQRGWVKQGGGWQPHTNFQQGRDQNWTADHRDWSQRGGYGGSYIPQASFGVYFGSAHFFHIGVMPVMYMGYPRFAYSGYSFMLLDPWPGSWREDWYTSDDVYIDYSDGYYLHDRRYPGVSLAITVVL